jgi:hypothetical protein
MVPFTSSPQYFDRSRLERLCTVRLVTSITCVCADIPRALWLVRAGPEDDPLVIVLHSTFSDATAEYPSVV